MKKPALFLACLTLAHVPVGAFYGAAFAADSAEATATVDAKDYVGDSIYAEGGRRIAAVYSATPAGDAQVILGVKMVTIPVSTLYVNEGKLTTTLSKADVMKMR